ncbi:phosphatidate cytidylyltransferase [Calothrix sp. NIES-4071]|nr:phosphatidate cytidylyltransferase [Calothrix sp. NIES-4071]BAZ55377.1 phosphatidate cytidylyltransferase [Calothrix sp. NIES-4105]
MITSYDFIGLGISYAYAATLLLVGEVLQRVVGIKPDLTRKFVHIGAGMWIFGILLLFNTWQIGIVPFVSFIFVNFILYRYKVIRALDSSNTSPGTVYFTISVTLLFAVFWRPLTFDQVPIAVAGLMVMTWGDALAALIGKHYGKHKYQFGQSIKSLEGSAVMFVVSTIVIFIVLKFLPGSLLSPNSLQWEMWKLVFVSLLSAGVATVVEAISPYGTDNLTVPLVAAGVIGIIGNV